MEEFNQGSSERWAEYEQEGDDISIDDEMLWEMLEVEDSLQHVLEQRIHAFDLKLREDLRQRKIQQERLAYVLSGISPVAAYQIGAMSLAGTDAEIKKRYEDAANNFRHEFYEHVEKKKKETGDLGRMIVTFTMDDDGNQSMSSAGDREPGKLDTDGLPKFSPPKQTLSEAISPTVLPIGMILMYSIVAFGAASVAFVRYDVR